MPTLRRLTTPLKIAAAAVVAMPFEDAMAAFDPLDKRAVPRWAGGQ